MTLGFGPEHWRASLACLTAYECWVGITTDGGIICVGPRTKHAAMADLIHPTAVISNDARLGSNVRVLPFSVISGAVEIGDDSVVGPHAVIHDYVRMGRNNRVHAHSVIGDLPQDVSFDNEETWVEIGDDNNIRECVTIHRSTSVDRPTRIGSGCFFMAMSHVGHDCQVGNNVIATNYVGLAGHVICEDGCVLGGGTLIHQFTRIGRLAMVAGRTAVRMDVLPFTLLGGQPVRHRGPNAVGLRRAGVRGDRYRAVKEALKAIKGGEGLDDLPDTEEVNILRDWLSHPSKRGIYGFGAAKGFEL